MSTLIKENKKVYDSLYEWEEDGWEEKDKRYNFYWLFKIEKYANKRLDGCSILDVGCGTGDIVKYLPDDVRYTGVDIYKPALELARKRYKTPEHRFLYKNILTSVFKRKYDFVFSSGALSLNLKPINKSNYEFLKKAVSKMWNLCKYGVAFNILTDEKFKRNDTYLFHYNMDKVEKILEKIVKDTKIQNQNSGKKIRSKYTPIDKDNDQHTIYLIR